nr:putative ribonuclease H-like domain-containing protein [Tanacetum cinerariifolium]
MKMEILLEPTSNKLMVADERQVSDEFNGGTHILFGPSGKSASTPIDIEKPLLKDPDGEDVDVHIYRLISWQCKKQTVVATSSTEAEYIVTANCYAQVLWIQNQLLDYGKIHTLDGNLVKEILLKLNLPDHTSILIDSQMEVKVPISGCLKDS